MQLSWQPLALARGLREAAGGGGGGALQTPQPHPQPQALAGCWPEAVLCTWTSAEGSSNMAAGFHGRGEERTQDRSHSLLMTRPWMWHILASAKSYSLEAGQ